MRGSVVAVSPRKNAPSTTNRWISTSHVFKNASPPSTSALTTIATHNPLGLIVSTGIKVHEEKTGSDTLQGRAKATAKEIADVLKQRFRDQGWIK